MNRSSFQKWFDNISITKKLYFVVITMAALITVELLSLSFAINSLSAIRGYVTGEGLWAKAQKDATYSLRKYAYTHDEKDYQLFITFLNVPLGDKKARIELTKSEPDQGRLTQAFLEGRNNVLDIDGMLKLYERFQSMYIMKEAMSLWAEADKELGRLQTLGLKLHNILLSKKATLNEINKTLIEIDKINTRAMIWTHPPF